MVALDAETIRNMRGKGVSFGLEETRAYLEDTYGFQEFLACLKELSAANPLTLGLHTGLSKSPVGQQLMAYLRRCYNNKMTIDEVLIDWM